MRGCMHIYTFPKVKQMPNLSFSACDNQTLMKQVIPPGTWPSLYIQLCFNCGTPVCKIVALQEHGTYIVWWFHGVICKCRRWQAWLFLEMCMSKYMYELLFGTQADSVPLNVSSRGAYSASFTWRRSVQFDGGAAALFHNPAIFIYLYIF